MGLDKMALSNDDYCMIVSNHFGMGALKKKAGMSQAGSDWSNIMTVTGTMTSLFVLAMMSCILPWIGVIVCFALIGCIIVFRFFIFALYLLAVVKGNYLKPFYRSSIMFWGFWPTVTLALSLVSAFPGAIAGEWLWTANLSPYFQYKELQMYKDVNPSHVSGQRLQDAGMIDFTSLVEMDRGKGGCFMHTGHTYCVAPIVDGGEVKFTLNDMPQSGSFDYFAVGIDCCTCPNKDFRCGEWDNPYAQGAFRSLDYKSRPFYKLALDDWIASYGKPVKNPLFLEWVEGPEWKWKTFWNTALYAGWLAVTCAFAASLTIGFLLDKILQVLWGQDIVAPRVGLAPAPRCGRLTEALLPRMFYYYQDEQEQLAAMPVGTIDYRATPGPGTVSAATGNYGTLHTEEGRRDEQRSGLAPPGWARSGAENLMAPPTASYY